MSHIVADIQSVAEMNNMELNPDKSKGMIVDFIQSKTVVFWNLSSLVQYMQKLYHHFN